MAYLIDDKLVRASKVSTVRQSIARTEWNHEMTYYSTFRVEKGPRKEI